MERALLNGRNPSLHLGPHQNFFKNVFIIIKKYWQRCPFYHLKKSLFKVVFTIIKNTSSNIVFFIINFLKIYSPPKTCSKMSLQLSKSFFKDVSTWLPRCPSNRLQTLPQTPPYASPYTSPNSLPNTSSDTPRCPDSVWVSGRHRPKNPTDTTLTLTPTKYRLTIY